MEKHVCIVSSKIFYRELWLKKLFFYLTVGLIQFWESSQMFDLHHPNKEQLNFTQQNWQTVGQQILENLAFEQNTNMLMEKQKTWMFLMSFSSQSENDSALIQWAAGRKLSNISWVLSPAAQDKTLLLDTDD